VDLKKRLASLDRLTRKSAEPARNIPETAREQVHHSLAQMGLHPIDGADHGPLQAEYRDQVPRPCSPLPDLSGFFTGTDLAELDPRRVLFLDTETTGLVSGTGTIAFLVGVSWWADSGNLVTRQYFLPGPAAESRLLILLEELVSRFTAVATYNGASFDLPLLRTRSLLNRRENVLEGLRSLDLLVPARRLWGRTLADCRQQTVEQGICGLVRSKQDIPGHLIPQVWFNFLKQGETEDLGRVLYHNRRDMVGMASIFNHLVRAAGLLPSDPETGEWQEIDWRRAWGLGRIAEWRGEPELATAWMQRSVELVEEAGGSGFREERFVADALRIIKRSGRWQVVENIIARALGCSQNGTWLHREAAILYEHRLVRLEVAMRHALCAQDSHRVERLEKKLSRHR
jgi:uncharacterized protein YprB with RNaseH-like and TPR domain